MSSESVKQGVAAADSEAIVDSDADGDEEAYDPTYDEDEDDEQNADPIETSQGLNRSRPGVALNPVREEIQSVDEEESESGLLKIDGLGDVADIKTPKEQ